MLAEKLRAAASSFDASWDLANAVYQGSPVNWYRVAEENDPTGIFFKPDGLKMYVVGSSLIAANLHEYNLSTAWDISTASFVQSITVYYDDPDPEDIFFRPDGLKMYVSGNYNAAIYEYDLSTAWDISTASYLQTLSLFNQVNDPTGIFFRPDGLKLYVASYAGNSVWEFDLSTAWDISTASYVQFKAVQNAPEAVFFTSDGLIMFVIGWSNKRVYRYVLSTAWDVSTAINTQSFLPTSQQALPQGLFFKPDGLKMYVTGPSLKTSYQYDLSTAWDLNSASFSYPTSNYFSVAAQETAPRGIFFKPDGLKLYILGAAADSITSYDLATPWDINSATYSQSISIGIHDSNPYGLYFRPDGLQLYFVGESNDRVIGLNLSTAWDITSVSSSQITSVNSQEAFPLAVFFTPDGLSMYVLGGIGDDVNEYSLSTAWNITTKTFVQSKSFSAQGTSFAGLFFKPDGSLMYILNLNTNTVLEYELSTPWNVSTASYVQNFELNGRSWSPYAIYFKPAGTTMYIVSSDSDTILGYNFV